jgi:DNA-binding CsgD family transcriptional regulator
MAGYLLDPIDIPWSSAAEVLNCLQIGVIFADAGSRVLAANGAAQELSALRDGIEISQERLRTARPRETSALQGMIAADRAPAFLSLSRPSGKRPLAVLVRPLSRDPRSDDSGQPAAVVFINDPERHSIVDPLSLQRLYGLTPAESSVASLIGVGQPVSDAAHQLDVQANTIRIQLKQIYAKTGAHHQSALVGLILSGPAQIRLN